MGKAQAQQAEQQQFPLRQTAQKAQAHKLQAGRPHLLGDGAQYPGRLAFLCLDVPGRKQGFLAGIRRQDQGRIFPVGIGLEHTA